MANIAFNTLYDQILPYLPGAETALVDSQIRKVLREFMKRTTMIRQRITFNTSIGIPTYMLVPTFGQVASVLHAWHAPSQTPLAVYVEPRTQRALDPGAPKAWLQMVPGYIQIAPTPDAVYPIEVEVAVTLKQTDAVFPEEIRDNYAEAVAAGVLAMMYSMPGKPWTQGQAAKESGRVFSGMIKSIRAELRDGGQPNQSTFQGVARFGV